MTCLSLTMAQFISGAETKPAPAPPNSHFSMPLTNDGLIGAWMGKINMPIDKGDKKWETTRVFLAFYRDGKFGLVLLVPADDIDPNGAKGFEYDYPLRGTWKLEGQEVLITPEEGDDHPGEDEIKPFKLAITRPDQNLLELDLACLLEPHAPLGNQSKILLVQATDQDVKALLGGNRPK